MKDTFITPAQALSELAAFGIIISPCAIYNHCRSGVLPSTKIGRRYFIRRSDFDSYINGKK